MKIPIKAYSNGLWYVVNKPQQPYYCTVQNCRYTHTNKATVAGHLMMMHGFSDEQALQDVNAQRRRYDGSHRSHSR